MTHGLDSSAAAGRSGRRCTSLTNRIPRILPAQNVMDGINAARVTIGSAWFDSEKCHAGLEALRAYRADYDEKAKVFHDRPKHDFGSHARIRGATCRWPGVRRSRRSRRRRSETHGTWLLSARFPATPTQITPGGRVNADHRRSGQHRRSDQADRAVELRAFSTAAEADADTEPPRPGMELVRVITGVPRADRGAHPMTKNEWLARYDLAGPLRLGDEPNVALAVGARDGSACPASADGAFGTSH